MFLPCAMRRALIFATIPMLAASASAHAWTWGRTNPPIETVTPGGIVGSVAQEVVGVPKFRKGDEHVVFVRQSKAGPTVLYLEQGAYRISRILQTAPWDINVRSALRQPGLKVKEGDWISIDGTNGAVYVEESQVEPSALELMRSYAASKWDVYRKVRLPA
mgnify:CR=1 FL=1